MATINRVAAINQALDEYKCFSFVANGCHENSSREDCPQGGFPYVFSNPVSPERRNAHHR